jgi:adenylate cyclase
MKKPIILCVDDEPAILESLEIELQRALGAGYLIETASSGEEALELLEELLENNYEIPLVISDQIMPDIKGDDLLKRIHAISPKTFKIMLTGQADLDAVGNAIKYARLYRYIAKPWQSDDLHLTVTEAINSYYLEKKLAEKQIKLEEMNAELAKANAELGKANSVQSALISRLRENENRLRQFLEAMPIGVVVLDAKATPCYLNQKAQEIFGKGIVPGVKPEELSAVYQIYQTGKNQQYPPEKLAFLQALKGENASADDLEIHRSDKIIPVEVSAMPIYNSKGEIAYAINTIKDITLRKQAETDRDSLIAELFELNCNLELALEAESKLANAARRFVPNEFLSLLGKDSLVDVQLGDQVQQEMSVLFCDIRDFTAISEGMTPAENFAFINAYLKWMEPAIAQHNGFIDKYMGDGIMALFSGGADDAVKAGIAMLENLKKFNEQQIKLGNEPIKIGIGINTGSMMLGTVGGKNRMEGTVISDAVNLASRIEGMTKSYGVAMLITHQTFLQLNEPIYAIRPIDLVRVKGKQKLVMIHEVFEADLAKMKEGKRSTFYTFIDGLDKFRRGLYGEAEELFTTCVRRNPLDKVAQIYLERCLEPGKYNAFFRELKPLRTRASA